MGYKTDNNIKSQQDCWVKWIGNFTSASGYSEGIRAMMKGFFQNGFKISISPQIYGPGTRMSKDVFEIYESFREADLNKRYITLQTMPPSSFINDTESYFNIGRTADESSGISEEWVSKCNEMDEIWVPSSFNKSTFIKSGVAEEKIFVMPDAIDLGLFNSDVKPLEIEGEKSFNFLSIFDWKLKKGWDVLFESFISEFSSSDDVSLIVRTFSFLGVSFKDIRNHINNIMRVKAGKNIQESPRIIIIEKMLNQEEMAGLYKACDCFVLPTRGEGWGRPFMEAMAMGIPVVGTRWGGHLDFMNDSNSYLIDCDIVNIPREGTYEISSFKNKKWANPSVSHLRRLLRRIYENRSEANDTGLKGRNHIINNFDSKIVAKKIIQRLEEIRDWDKRKFRILVDKDQKEEFISYWGNGKLSEVLNDNQHFVIDFFSKGERFDSEEYISDKKNIIHLQVNDFNDFKIPFNCHTVLLLDNRSTLWGDIQNGKPGVMSEMQYNIDDIWIKGEQELKILADGRILKEDIFLTDGTDEPGKDPDTEIKNRLVLIKRKPIKRYLEENFLNIIRSQPYLIDDLKRRSILTFVDYDNPGDLKILIGNFIKKFSDRDSVSLVISTNTGKARDVYHYIDKVINKSGLTGESADDVPDIVIFDGVIGHNEIMRLINQVSCFIRFKSTLSDEFISGASRFKKRIIDFNKKIEI